jgi:hypothetical protein
MIFAEIYFKGERMTTHNRFPSHMMNTHTTHPEDVPHAFPSIVQWYDEWIRNRAGSIGESTR